MPHNWTLRTINGSRGKFHVANLLGYEFFTTMKRKLSDLPWTPSTLSTSVPELTAVHSGCAQQTQSDGPLGLVQSKRPGCSSQHGPRRSGRRVAEGCRPACHVHRGGTPPSRVPDPLPRHGGLGHSWQPTQRSRELRTDFHASAMDARAAPAWDDHTGGQGGRADRHRGRGGFSHQPSGGAAGPGAAGPVREAGAPGPVVWVCAITRFPWQQAACSCVTRALPTLLRAQLLLPETPAPRPGHPPGAPGVSEAAGARQHQARATPGTAPARRNREIPRPLQDSPSQRKGRGRWPRAPLTPFRRRQSRGR